MSSRTQREIETYNFAKCRDAARVLATKSTPSTVHMAPEEREDAICTMLSDLDLLAANDGCIAAAWALEFALATAADIRDGKYTK